MIVPRIIDIHGETTHRGAPIAAIVEFYEQLPDGEEREVMAFYQGVDTLIIQLVDRTDWLIVCNDHAHDDNFVDQNHDTLEEAIVVLRLVAEGWSDD